jgi:SAM-dependent methyltransferase
MTPLSPQARRLRAHERWLARPSLGSIASRWAMSPAGVFLTSSPLFRLPENLQLTSSLRVLEIGTGRGALLRMLDGRLRFDRPPTGIDLSAQALWLAQRDERRAGGALRLARASGTALPFADGSFDMVLCGHHVRLLADPELIELLREVRRTLAEGGLALVWDFALTGNRTLDRWNARVLATGGEPPRLRSTQALLQAAELAGFDFAGDAHLRPFLLPPIPRASILIGRPPKAAATGAS